MVLVRSLHAVCRPALVLVWTVALVVGLQSTGVAQAAATPTEVRALWVLRPALASADAIESVVRTARDAGFNTLIVQVRARGDAMFPGGVEPMVAGLPGQVAGFDPLAEVLRQSQAAGLQVHAWISVNLVSSAVQLPVASDHIVYRHPEWLMVPRDLARELAAVDFKSPAYVGKLARWTRAHPRDVEGLYTSPLHPEAVDHAVEVLRDLVSRYDVDGVHFDYMRYPSDEFDYSRAALSAFREEMRGELSSELRQRLESLLADDPLVYPDTFPEAWTRYRRSRLTALAMRLRSAVKQVRLSLVVSAAVVADQVDARDHRLQDWSTWLEAGLLDVACPLAYTTDPATFSRQVAAARQIPGVHDLWVGIGAYRLTVPRTLENIFAARQEGVEGIAIFSYDSLAPDAHDQSDYLVQVGRLAFRGGGPSVASVP